MSRRLSSVRAFPIFAAAVLTTPLVSSVTVVAPLAASEPPAVTRAADAVSAMAAARESGQRVEVLDERTETGQVFANPAGTMTLEQSAAPVRVRRGDGWVPVDTTLARQPDGSVAPIASAVGLRLSGGGNTPAITIAKDNRELSLSWPGRLPAPVLSADTATYVDVKPGVDLRLRATADGFTQVLVVKDRAAAAGLDRLGYRVATRGVSLRPADGGLTAVDESGRSVFVPAAAMMWDTPRPPSNAAEQQGWDLAGAPPGRQVRVPVTLEGDELVVTPDRAMLTDAATNYPVSIDPSYFMPRPWAAWMHLELLSPGQPGWGYDQDDGGAKVGFSDWDSPTVLRRSFFQYDVSPLWGKEIHGAWFSVKMNHSASCTDTPVELWMTGAIDTGTRWDNTGNGWWHQHLDTRSGHAHDLPGACGFEPDLDMEFGHSVGMRDAVRARTDASGMVTLGLKAPNEGDRLQWKKFWPNSAVLHVEYNSWPNPPSNLYADINLPCMTGDARPVTNTSPTLFATGVDVDGGNVEMQFQWEYTTGGVAGTYRHPYQGSGSRFSAVVPATGLQDGRTYRWHSRAGDGAFAWGPWSAWCEFAFDTTRPTATPTVASTSFPEGGTGVPVGTRGDFTFTSTDPDVHGYRYGLTQSTTYFVAAGAGPDRRATVPVTMWSDSTHSLYVYSVDRAGNRSQNYRQYLFAADEASTTPPRVRGDINGDGLADVAAVHSRDADETALLTFTSKGGGLWYEPLRTWDSGPNTAFLRNRLQSNSADFNGDGRSDLATLRDEGNTGITAWVFHANGSGYDVPAAPAWSSGANNWALGSGRTVAGDVNGDGKADLVNFHNYPNKRTKIWVFYGTATGVSAPVMVWDSTEGHWDWSQCREVVGDFNGDGRADIADWCNYPNRQTKIWLFRGISTGVASPVLGWDSGVGNWDWAPCREVAGDVTGDGKADMGDWCDYGNGQTKLWLFRGTATAVAAPTLGWDSGPGSTWRADLKPVAGDFNGDGKSDMGYFYRYVNNRTKLWVMDGAATGVVSPPLMRWDSGDWVLDWDRTSFF